MSDLGNMIFRIVFWICLGATLYTYFLYPLLLLLLSRVVRCWRDRRVSTIASESKDMEMLPQVTMVISAYNEQAVLPGKIDNCRELEYPRDKLSFVIGSDGSNDGTMRILRQIDDPRFTTFHSRIRRGKVQMLNHLMQLVSGEIVVFSDANTIYRPDAIGELVKFFQSKKTGVVIGKLELSVPADDTEACQTESLYWRYENHIKQWESVLG
ncbi:MAG: glycosyltransferase, partial [Planctomycetes bacterium]|nr:glycosyltransferase [Planctomycetota bacterium]